MNKKKKTVVILNKNPIQKSVFTIDNLKNKKHAQSHAHSNWTWQ